MASFEERILAYLDGTLDEKEREDFLHTLSTSPEKREVLESHLRLQRLLTVVQKPVSAPLDVQRSLAGLIPAIGRRLPYLVGAPSEQQRNAFLLWWSNSRASFKVALGVALLSALATGTYMASRPNTKMISVVDTKAAGQNIAPTNSTSTEAINESPRVRNTIPSIPHTTRTSTARTSPPESGHDAKRLENWTNRTSLIGRTDISNESIASIPSNSSIISTPSNPPPTPDPTIALLAAPRTSAIQIADPATTSIRFADPNADEPPAHRLQVYALAFGGATITRPFKLSDKMMRLGLGDMSTNAAVAGGYEAGVSYAITPWLALGGELGYEPFARIQPFSYNESLDGYPFLTRHVYDSYIVHSSLPFARFVSRITFEPEYPVHAGLVGGVGLVFANTATPMGMLGLTVDWRTSGAITIHSLVGVDVASIAAQTPLGEADPSATRFGVVHRDLGTGSLFNAIPNIGLGISYSPEF